MARAMPVKDMMLDEMPNISRKMKPAATEIGSWIRIINALRQ
jgi:hypothetical protein